MKVNLSRWTRTCVYRTCILFPLSIKHNRILRRVRKTKHAKVVFMASNLPMWRYQNLIESLQKDPRFEVHILLVPFLRYKESERRHTVEQLKSFFDSCQISYVDTTDPRFNNVNVLDSISPDIIFYQQPYAQMLDTRYDSSSHQDKLLAYYPYGLSTIDSDWQYRLKFFNVAWKIYYSSESQKKDAVKRTYNSGRNMIVVGDPDYDRFLAPVQGDVWKCQPIPKKRIIWAPHFSITSGNRLYRDSFVWMSALMIRMADQYKDVIQIAFKPHPLLLQELYNHPDWGKTKADSYYQSWRKMGNGQLVEGDFIDLFKTSDALIHDCGTFTGEYLYTRKPSMFVSRHINTEWTELNELGRAALSSHYIGKDESDVESFILNVVIKGEDSMRQQRLFFYDRFLRPVSGDSVTSNTYYDMVNSLWHYEYNKS